MSRRKELRKQCSSIFAGLYKILESLGSMGCALVWVELGLRVLGVGGVSGSVGKKNSGLGPCVGKREKGSGC